MIEFFKQLHRSNSNSTSQQTAAETQHWRHHREKRDFIESAQCNDYLHMAKRERKLNWIDSAAPAFYRLHFRFSKKKLLQSKFNFHLRAFNPVLLPFFIRDQSEWCSTKLNSPSRTHLLKRREWCWSAS